MCIDCRTSMCLVKFWVPLCRFRVCSPLYPTNSTQQPTPALCPSMSVASSPWVVSLVLLNMRIYRSKFEYLSSINNSGTLVCSSLQTSLVNSANTHQAEWLTRWPAICATEVSQFLRERVFESHRCRTNQSFCSHGAMNAHLYTNLVRHAATTRS
jgi:hypothetical protein